MGRTKILRTPIRDEVEASFVGVPAMLTVSQARQQLGGMARSTLYELIADGRITAISAGRHRLIPKRSLIDYLAPREVA